MVVPRGQALSHRFPPSSQLPAGRVLRFGDDLILPCWEGMRQQLHTLTYRDGVDGVGITIIVAVVAVLPAVAAGHDEDAPKAPATRYHAMLQGGLWRRNRRWSVPLPRPRSPPRAAAGLSRTSGAPRCEPRRRRTRAPLPSSLCWGSSRPVHSSQAEDVLESSVLASPSSSQRPRTKISTASPASVRGASRASHDPSGPYFARLAASGSCVCHSPDQTPRCQSKRGARAATRPTSALGTGPSAAYDDFKRPLRSKSEKGTAAFQAATAQRPARARTPEDTRRARRASPQQGSLRSRLFRSSSALLPTESTHSRPLPRCKAPVPTHARAWPPHPAWQARVHPDRQQARPHGGYAARGRAPPESSPTALLCPPCGRRRHPLPRPGSPPGVCCNKTSSARAPRPGARYSCLCTQEESTLTRRTGKHFSP